MMGKLRNMATIYLFRKDKLMLLFRQGGQVVNDVYVNSISEVFDKHSENRIVNYPYITRCYIGKVHLSCINI